MPDRTPEEIRTAVAEAVEYGFDWGTDDRYVTPEQLKRIIADALIAVLDAS